MKDIKTSKDYHDAVVVLTAQLKQGIEDVTMDALKQWFDVDEITEKIAKKVERVYYADQPSCFFLVVLYNGSKQMLGKVHWSVTNNITIGFEPGEFINKKYILDGQEKSK